ncbi:hypothetical protein [Caulobacter sp. BK020]|uniref:hypothetical protein n=1 Tax=Caulobacter sp. BK020 TaxID=2512117 RepID=UPI0010448E35|nr:hypothetical protein [Caulobacter sp. BK020]TCS12807.1 hypothetical protein EV278_1111 [Caulobacter sp. BK020]
MIPVDFLVQFGVTWLIVVAYVTALFSVGFRLGRLKVQRPGLDAPSLEFRQWAIAPSDIWAVFGFAFSGRHAQVGDPLVSRLVIAVRVLFPLSLILVLAIFARAASLGGLVFGD